MRTTYLTAPLALLLAVVLGGPLVARAERYDWAEGTDSLDDGATRDYYNRGGLLAWDNFLGDWTDASGLAQGGAAYAVANVVDDDSDRVIDWDVTALARQWADGVHRNQGMLLRDVGGNGPIDFRSKEHPVDAERH